MRGNIIELHRMIHGMDKVGKEKLFYLFENTSPEVIQ